MAVMRWVRRDPRSIGLRLIVAAGLEIALAGMVAGAPALALGATGASPGETGTSYIAAGIWCPALARSAPIPAGEPLELTAGVGSRQSAAVGTPFPLRLAITVTDAQRNPVPGALVTFSAPSTGASGRFTAHSRGQAHHHAPISPPYTVKVKTNACGIAVAPAFTANDTRGGYIVKATARHARPAAFALVNLAPGQSP